MKAWSLFKEFFQFRGCFNSFAALIRVCKASTCTDTAFCFSNWCLYLIERWMPCITFLGVVVLFSCTIWSRVFHEQFAPFHMLLPSKTNGNAKSVVLFDELWWSTLPCQYFDTTNNTFRLWWLLFLLQYNLRRHFISVFLTLLLAFSRRYLIICFEV